MTSDPFDFDDISRGLWRLAALLVLIFGGALALAYAFAAAFGVL